MPGKKDKKKDKVRAVPGPLSGSLSEANDVPDAMGPPPSDAVRPDAAVALNDFFPIPGESADWSKAFTLEGSDIPLPRPDGTVSVAGKSTLWRQIKPPASAPPSSPVQGDINQRLDALTRQLESLSSSSASPTQSTAELFLFIAIGLLFILAIDTLLRCATSIALAARSGSRGSTSSWSLTGGGRGRRWRFR